MEHTAADKLIAAADAMLLPKGDMIVCVSDYEDSWSRPRLAYAATAVRFRSMPSVFQFRAMVEGWSLQEIVREMH